MLLERPRDAARRPLAAISGIPAGRATSGRGWPAPGDPAQTAGAAQTIQANTAGRRPDPKELDFIVGSGNGTARRAGDPGAAPGPGPCRARCRSPRSLDRCGGWQTSAGLRFAAALYPCTSRCCRHPAVQGAGPGRRAAGSDPTLTAAGGGISAPCACPGARPGRRQRRALLCRLKCRALGAAAYIPLRTTLLSPALAPAPPVALALLLSACHRLAGRHR